jgi:hypothetical protein
MPEELKICGFALAEIELLRAGGGDRKQGRVVLALERVAKLEPAGPQQLPEYGLGCNHRGEHAPAEHAFRWALTMTPKDDHWYVMMVDGHAEALMKLGFLAEADSLFAHATAVEAKKDGPIMSRRRHLAELRAKQGRAREAEELLRAIVADLARVQGETHWQVGDALVELASFLRRNRQPAEAQSLEARAVAIYRGHIETIRGKDGLDVVVTRMENQIRELQSRPSAC